MTMTQYDPRITPEFVMACAKAGSVRVFSTQVTISDRRELNLRDLAVPSDFAIEWVGHDADHVQVTFKLKGKPHA